MKINNLADDRKLNKAYRLSILVTGLFFFNALLSAVFSSTVYKTVELYNTFLANDLVNVIIGTITVLIISLLIKKANALGLFFLLGWMFFIIYNQIIYLVALAEIYSFVINALILSMTILALTLLMRALLFADIAAKLKAGFPHKTLGFIAIGLGLLFVVFALTNLINHYTGHKILSLPEMAVNSSDIFICSFWIVAGVLILIKSSWAYPLIISVFFQATALFIGLLLVLVLNPLIGRTEFKAADFTVIAVMSLICIIPFVFLTGKVNKVNANE